jgi:hypothetical protein
MFLRILPFLKIATGMTRNEKITVNKIRLTINPSASPKANQTIPKYRKGAGQIINKIVSAIAVCRKNIFSEKRKISKTIRMSASPEPKICTMVNFFFN